MEKVVFKTKDNVEIHGFYVVAEDKRAPAVLLLHMMPAVKESWREFQGKLREAGFQSLAIDLRGHGESRWRARTDADLTQKNAEQNLDYHNFSDEEQQKKIYDVEAAINFLVERGIAVKNIALAGASIGANLALQYQAEHKEIKATVLLSAGLNYRGVETEPPAKRILPEQSAFLSGAKEDMRSSGASCADVAQTLFDLLPSKNKKIAVFEGKEHGTDLFISHSGLMDNVIKWLKEVYSIEL